jgi:hypothetical protein
VKKTPKPSLPPAAAKSPGSPAGVDQPQASPSPVRAIALSRRHLCFGWWSLAGYLSFGIFLEVVHAFKWGWYVDVGNETRRLMFTLAHAHGTLLAIINLAVGLSLRVIPTARVSASTSYSLVWAGLLLPFGFFLGGIVTYGGDPGLGILLVPIGGLLLLYGVICAAWAFTKKES